MPIEPINSRNAVNPLAFMGEVHVFYAFTADSIQQIESGVFRTSAGENLQMRRITGEMMKGNQGLIAEVHGLALRGHLGFAAQGSNNIRFRSDVADKIGMARSFQVFPVGHPEQTEQFIARISGVDKTEYTNLAEQFISLEIDEKAEGGKKGKAPAAEHARHAPAAPRSEKVLPNVNAKAVDQLTRSVGQQNETIKQNHLKHVAEERKKDAKREREEVKEREIKREIMKGEINRVERKHGDNRQVLNSGEEIDVSNNKPKNIPPKPSEKIKKRRLN